MSSPMSSVAAAWEPKLDQTLRGHGGVVTSVAFHPIIFDSSTNGSHNSCGRRKGDSNDGSSRDRCKNGKVNAHCSGHGEKWDDARNYENEETPHRPYSSREYRRPNQQIASAASDGTVMIWNIHGGKVVGGGGGGGFSDGGSGGCGDGGCNRSPTKSGQKTEEDVVRAYRLIGHQGPIHRITYSPSGKLLASCSSDNTVRLWVPSQTFSKGESVVLRGHSGNVRCVDFGSAISLQSHNCNDDGNGFERNDATGDTGGILPSTKDVASVLLTCSDDKTIKLWSLPHTSFRNSLVGHTNWVRVSKFPKKSTCDNGLRTTQLCASGGDDKTVRIWDCDRGVNVAVFNFCGDGGGGPGSGNVGGAARALGGVRDLDFLPTGTALAASGTDGFIRFYDLRCDSVVQQIYVPPYDSYATNTKAARGMVDSGKAISTVDSLSIHPNGIHILCSSADSAKMWDLRYSRSALFEIPCVASIGKNSHSNNARLPSPNSPKGNHSSKNCVIPSTISFSPDGSHFALSLRDNAVRVYQWNGEVHHAEFLQNHDVLNGKVSSAPETRMTSQRRKSQRIETPKEVVTDDLVGPAAYEQHHPSAKFVNANDDIENRDDFPQEGSMENMKERSHLLETTKNDRLSHHPAPTVSSTWKYNKENLPEILSGTLDRIVGQLDILAKTVIMLERRLSIQESTMTRVKLQQQKIFDICNNSNLDCAEKVNLLQLAQQEQQQQPMQRQEVTPHSYPEQYHHMHPQPIQRDAVAVPKWNSNSSSKSAECIRPTTSAESDISVIVDEKVESVLRRHLNLPALVARVNGNESIAKELVENVQEK